MNDEHGPDVPTQLPPLGQFTDHEREMLYHLAQEAGEVVQSVTKLLLFGPRATNPHTGKQYDNGQDLAMELGNLHYMVEVCYHLGLFPAQGIQEGMNMKEERLALYQRTTAP